MLRLRHVLNVLRRGTLYVLNGLERLAAPPRTYHRRILRSIPHLPEHVKLHHKQRHSKTSERIVMESTHMIRTPVLPYPSVQLVYHTHAPHPETVIRQPLRNLSSIWVRTAFVLKPGKRSSSAFSFRLLTVSPRVKSFRFGSSR